VLLHHYQHRKKLKKLKNLKKGKKKGKRKMEVIYENGVEMKVCKHCGEVVAVHDGAVIEGNLYCDDCVDELFTTCNHCGKYVLIGDTYAVQEELYCEYCYDNHTTICQHCGERHDDCDMHFDDFGNAVCDWCFDDWYTRCDRCERLIHWDNRNYYDDMDLCDFCYEELTATNAINNYYYKPSPIFYPSFVPNTLYMGVELEVDKAGENHENAQRLLDIMNSSNDLIYCKHDGSLSNGFEIVSHPMTLDYHTHHTSWLDLCREAVAMGYRSHNTSTCGLHIHVNRDFFGYSWTEQEDNIAKVVHMVESFWNELTIFSRRDYSRLEQWASRTGIYSKVQDTYKKAKDSCGDRYKAVNLTNDNTIEFRLFRGTLKHSTFIATLQLVHSICTIATLLTDEEVERLSWSEFVKKITFNELIQYLKVKSLYINDSVEIEESEEE
jgi:formylmethanofuran dehydrogenase subunit E